MLHRIVCSTEAIRAVLSTKGASVVAVQTITERIFLVSNAVLFHVFRLVNKSDALTFRTFVLSLTAFGGTHTAFPIPPKGANV